MTYPRLIESRATMGKKWWKKTLGISGLQRKASRKIGVRLSDGKPSKGSGCGCLILLLFLLSILAIAAERPKPPGQTTVRKFVLRDAKAGDLIDPPVAKVLVVEGKDIFCYAIDERAVYCARGVDTAGIVTGDVVDLPRPMKVTGTTKYTPKNGSTQTVLVLEPESKEERKKRIDAAKAKEAEEKKRQAEQDKADAARREAAAVEQRKKELADKIERDEKAAAAVLAIARQYVELKKPDKAIEKLNDLLAKYPDTKAAAEARKLLAELEKKKE